MVDAVSEKIAFYATLMETLFNDPTARRKVVFSFITTNLREGFNGQWSFTAHVNGVFFFYLTMWMESNHTHMIWEEHYKLWSCSVFNDNILMLIKIIGRKNSFKFQFGRVSLQMCITSHCVISNRKQAVDRQWT